MNDKIKWACPVCGADEHQNQGFFCECDANHSQDDDHGQTYAKACIEAICYNCGWSGEFPQMPWDKKDLPQWAQTALNQGWSPPWDWVPTLRKPDAK